MSINSFGRIFRFTTWGESHGPAIGCVIDGVPPCIPLTEADIQHHLDKRKPAQSKYTTQRKESDTVRILSGVFEGQTTGTALSLLIENEDQRSRDYGEIKDKFRPGHADYSYHAKYGIRDYRGGGRSSARETAMRVAAGAVARKILEAQGISIRAALTQIGDKPITTDQWDEAHIDTNPFWSPDPAITPIWAEYVDGIRKDGSSIGAVIEVRAYGVPAGWGAPIYGKLDSDLAMAMMNINAVKGVEIGNGFAAAAMRGEENADTMEMGADGQPIFHHNHSGGIAGGISTGQPIVARFAVKPTSSILTPVATIDTDGNNTDIRTKGRHDPCVGIRAVPVGEAMMASVLADHYLLAKALNHKAE